MKKIIDGKVYDTATAHRIFEWTNHYPANDLKYREKTLYQTAKGAYFLHHVGGAMTDMQQAAGNHAWTGSEDLERLSEEEVKSFLATHGGVEVYLAIFPAEEG